MNALSQIFASLDTDPRSEPDQAEAEGFRADGSITDPEVARRYILAGNATVTFVSKVTGTRFTYKVRRPKSDEADTGFRFVSVLNGPDNWANYAYIGYIRRDVFFPGGKKAKVRGDAPSVRAFAWVWQQVVRGSISESLEVWHDGQCGRCGRKLTVPSSVASGLGPECAGRMGL